MQTVFTKTLTDGGKFEAIYNADAAPHERKQAWVNGVRKASGLVFSWHWTVLDLINSDERMEISKAMEAAVAAHQQAIKSAAPATPKKTYRNYDRYYAATHYVGQASMDHPDSIF